MFPKIKIVLLGCGSFYFRTVIGEILASHSGSAWFGNPALRHRSEGNGYYVWLGSAYGPINIKVNIPNHTFKEAMLFSPDELPEQKELSLSKGTSISLNRLNVYSIIMFKTA